MRRLNLGRRLQLYIEPRDIWFGAYVAPDAVYVCPVPLVVFRWDRAGRRARLPLHIVYIADLGTEFDWWCSCLLINGSAKVSRRDAEADAVRAHTNHERTNDCA